MNKILAASLAAAIAVGAVAYVEESRIADLNGRIRKQQERTGTLNSQVEALNSELDDLRRKVEVFKTESEELRNRLADLSKSAATKNATAGTDQSSKQDLGKQWMKGIAKMFTDPEMRKSMRAQQLMGVRMLYKDLGKELGLSPQDTERLMEILVDRQMDQAAAGMKAFDSDSPTKAEDSAKLAADNKRYEEQLRSMLGDDKYRRLQSYESSMGDRYLFQQFEGQFNAAGEPLLASQKDHLLELMREERAKTPDQLSLGNRANIAQQIQALKSDESVDQYLASQQDFQKRVLARSRPYLSADQIATFEKVQQQQLEFMKTQIKVSREMFGVGK